MNTRSLLAAVVLSLVTSVASAGLEQPASVTIDLTAMTASGDMLTARRAKGKAELIGCGVRHYQGGIESGFCQANVGDDNLTTVVCFTDDAGLLDAIKSITAFSFITFAWNASGECTRIGNSANSFYLPRF